jgi:hypothetical protein
MNVAPEARGGSALLRILIFAELALPTQRSRFGGDIFRLGDHAFLLVEDRQAGVGQFIVGCRCDEPLAGFNRLIEFFLVRVSHGQRVQRVDVIRVLIERPQIGRDGLVQLVLREEFHPFVIIIFLIHSAGYLALLSEA